MRLTRDEIIGLITAVKEAGYRRFRIQEEGFLLELGEAGGRGLTPLATSTSGKAADVQTIHETREGLVAVTAPMTGTFYRSPAPGEPPFVEIGDKVEPSSTVCIIEVMKLFNSIPAGVAGEVTDINIENEGAVTAGQTCIWIKPAS